MKRRVIGVVVVWTGALAGLGWFVTTDRDLPTGPAGAWPIVVAAALIVLVEVLTRTGWYPKGLIFRRSSWTGK